MPKKILALIIIVMIFVGGIYYYATRDKLDVSRPVKKALINSFVSEFYANLSLKYPKFYAVQDGAKAFRVLIVGKTAEASGQLEIFSQKDGDPRAFTEEPKEKYTVGPDDNRFEAWLYYSPGDEQTKSELHQIYNSVKVK